ncbi:DUF3788 family protein [Candidatus Stoquefichus massiliensis]|uniref:DUF3788 family protein n=1 Tax=Candidatus Stoquefichus massiliensis TaxID=1470350 RepID=UPI00047FE85A|nr:DUF3788 family protein [Candidatus Stoquefichus massiliensis]
MYERMLNKQVVPTLEEMVVYCGENGERFSMINDWLTQIFHTQQKIVFPYGNKYGWGIGHYKNKKLVCNIFAESGSFTVMIRLLNKQYTMIYNDLKKYTQEYIDNKYSCGDGGWIHYRITCQDHYEDIKKLLEMKCL